ncbi:hypothetical protein QTO34_011568 [Cnephaeus nilssonii]|uniref:Regulator of hemoglobinization and erythroid cell expansion n=1 Tax=Cnephaeus nilssonii TaxID=3371016 RepID=A0AA40LF06_CNENI|nr:hypothetical protein QTO34_011568 [Eptesicus nilssonii]
MVLYIGNENQERARFFTGPLGNGSPDGSAGATTWKRGAQGGSSQVSSCCTGKRLSPTHSPRPPYRKLAMLTEDMKLWHGLVIAVVSLVLQACLLAAIYYLLSRHMAKENEQLLKRSRLWAPKPSLAHHRSPAAQETKETKETGAERSTPAWEPRYRNDCNTSSESSDTSDSAGRSPPPCQVMDTPSDPSPPYAAWGPKKVNYTQVVFPATGGLDNESALDYEDIEDMTDYVNINPKSHTHNLWTFVNPAASEPVEYSQVAM